MAEPERRRRRVRGSSAGAAPVSPPEAEETRPESGAGTERPAPPPRPPATGTGEESERGLRGLVGSGSSQVSVAAAMRARDAARPTDEQLAEAEQNLTVVRRNWMPREDLPRRS